MHKIIMEIQFFLDNFAKLELKGKQTAIIIVTMDNFFENALNEGT